MITENQCRFMLRLQNKHWSLRHFTKAQQNRSTETRTNVRHSTQQSELTTVRLLAQLHKKVLQVDKIQRRQKIITRILNREDNVDTRLQDTPVTRKK